MTEGYSALREAAAVIDLSRRGKIRATGEDRVRLFHAMTTNHITQLSPGQGCYAFFLNAQGRVLADVHLLLQPDLILLDTEPEIREKVYAHIDKYIIADDVVIEDVTDQLATLGIEGPRSREFLTEHGAPVPEASHETLAWGNRLVSRISTAGSDGFRLFLPAEEKASIIAEARRDGVPLATEADTETVRIENARPRYGQDISERYIANETQLLRALHFAKGCYLGQEIVERVRSRGQVHRLLSSLRIETAEPPAAGTELTADGTKAGEITSAAFSPALGMVVALGYVRDHYAGPGTQLQCGNATAKVATAAPS